MISSVSGYPILFTALWLVFTILWGGRSIVVRRDKKYATGKKVMDKNLRYKYVSHLVYACQIIMVVPMFWSNAPFWLKLYESDGLRMGGFVAVYAGLILSVVSLIYLGRNYSPCYDSHLPFELVTSGPYRYIRHPGWLSKLLVGIGTMCITGSLWLMPMMVWLIVEMRRTIQMEETSLMDGLPGFREYRERTHVMVPFVF